jgi:hypothetical protein
MAIALILLLTSTTHLYTILDSSIATAVSGWATASLLLLLLPILNNTVVRKTYLINSQLLLFLISTTAYANLNNLDTGTTSFRRSLIIQLQQQLEVGDSTTSAVSIPALPNMIVCTT